MSNGETMRYVVLPQALKNIWPSLGNEFITLIKDSSIVSIIGVTELIYQSNIVRSDIVKKGFTDRLLLWCYTSHLNLYPSRILNLC